MGVVGKKTVIMEKVDCKSRPLKKKKLIQKVNCERNKTMFIKKTVRQRNLEKESEFKGICLSI